MNATTNIESASTNIKPTTTPGWQTSEFWMTLLGHVGLVISAVSGFLPAKYAVLAAAASQVAYSLSRGLTKAGAAVGSANS